MQSPIQLLPDEQESNLHTRRTAAAIIGESLRQFDERVNRKEILPTWVGGRLRFDQAELERFIASKTAIHSEANQLKIVRKRAGLEPDELAALCGYEPEVVTAAEAGIQLPRQVFAELVAQAVFVIITGKEQVMQEAVAV